MRLIKRVSLSIVALVPPAQGVRATLTASGISRVVVAGGLFQDTFHTTVIRRPPEQIAFTSPINATGILQLEQEGELLLPFESMGVETFWELSLPRPANFLNYDTIADVLMTIEYTALSSANYREQVIRRLDPNVKSDRVFSFRNDFVDAFYELNNPRAGGGSIHVRFETRRNDFPPNINNLRIEHVVMYFARSDTASKSEVAEKDVPVPVANLIFEPKNSDGAFGGPAVSSSDGIISTRRKIPTNGGGSNSEPIGGIAVKWELIIEKHPVGKWELEFPEEMRTRFAGGEIKDILLVITYEASALQWPQY